MSRVQTPYGEILAEIAAKAERSKPKLQAKDRATVLWFMRPKSPEPEPDFYVWIDPFASAPAITETEDLS